MQKILLFIEATDQRELREPDKPAYDFDPGHLGNQVCVCVPLIFPEDGYYSRHGSDLQDDMGGHDPQVVFRETDKTEFRIDHVDFIAFPIQLPGK